MNANSNYKNERMLKVLIVIGIIAVLVSVYLQLLKPFINKSQILKRDSKRIEELTLINSALNELQKENHDAFLGESNKVYISIPSTNLKCEGLKLPSLPEGWEYRCKPETEYRKIDGQGWLPVNFTKLSNTPFKKLPVDLINKANKLNYYTFVNGEKKSNWVLTVLPESEKFLKEKALTDNGTDPSRFEIGSDLQLWAKPSRLVSYWKFDEGKGTTAADSSGNNNIGILINGPTWIEGKIGKALSFNGVDNYVDLGNPDILQMTNDFSISFNMNLNVSQSTVYAPISHGHEAGANNNGWVFQGLDAGIYFTYGNGKIYRQTDVVGDLRDNNWHSVVIIKSSTVGVKIYIDGILNAENPLGTDAIVLTELNFNVGRDPKYDRNIKGLIDEVRIYDRVLNIKEIK